MRYILSISTLLILMGATFLNNSIASAQQSLLPGEPLDIPPRGTTLELLPTTLIQKIDISNDAWDPSSPDPTGIAYWPSRGTLLIVDSEVDEMPRFFTGDNVFESSLTGTLLATCSTTNIYRRGWSNEPTGVAINPSNNHVFFSDDSGGGELHEVKPGPDGIYCTSDDTVTTVPSPGNSDPEGIAYGENKLFIAGGEDEEVYILDLGPNGVLGGGDDGPVTSFDTGALGFHDVEGVEYNPDHGTLFIVSTSRNDQYIGEVSLSGELINLYNLDYLGKISRSGLTYGPSSWNPDTKSIYLVSSGIDNRRDPDENDGTIWEIHLGTIPDEEPPSVLTVTIADVDPTNASSVQFIVAFSEPVVGVEEADFVLSTTDEIENASISEVSGRDTSYTVTVNTGTGNGTIRLDVVDRDRIQDRDGNPLGGPGAGNGSYTAGEFYTVEKVGSLLVEPASLDFEDSVIRIWATTQTATISNVGVGSIQLGKLSISDDETAGQTMFLTENNCDFARLQAGAICTFGTTFRPVKPGAVNGQILIPNDVLKQPYQIDLAGNGVAWFNFLCNRPVQIGSSTYQLLDVWLFTNIPKGVTGWIRHSRSLAFTN